MLIIALIILFTAAVLAGWVVFAPHRGLLLEPKTVKKAWWGVGVLFAVGFVVLAVVQQSHTQSAADRAPAEVAPKQETDEDDAGADEDDVADEEAEAEDDDDVTDTSDADEEAADDDTTATADQTETSTDNANSSSTSVTESRASAVSAPEAAPAPVQETPQPEQSTTNTTQNQGGGGRWYEYQPVPQTSNEQMVYISANIPNRYHLDPNCTGLQRYGGAQAVTLSQAQAKGYPVFCAYERYGR